MIRLLRKLAGKFTRPLLSPGVLYGIFVPQGALAKPKSWKMSEVFRFECYLLAFFQAVTFPIQKFWFSFLLQAQKTVMQYYLLGGDPLYTQATMPLCFLWVQLANLCPAIHVYKAHAMFGCHHLSM